MKIPDGQKQDFPQKYYLKSAFTGHYDGMSKISPRLRYLIPSDSLEPKTNVMRRIFAPGSGNGRAALLIKARFKKTSSVATLP